MSIVKKNLKATKGKKRWRKNIDVSNLIDETENIKHQEKLQKEIKEKLKQNPMYFIDEKPEASANTRAPLDPNRFKKKDRELTKAELKAVGKLTQKIMTKEKMKNIRANAKVPAQDSSTNASLNDLDAEIWENNESVKTRKNSGGVKGPAVLPPHEGQSYNPTYKAHKDLLKKVVEEEVEKEKKKEAVELYDKNQKHAAEQKRLIRLRKERAEAREKAKRKLAKQQEHKFMYLKKICKEIDKEAEEHKQKLEERQKKFEEEKALIEQGKLVKAKKVNKYKYEYPGTDFQLSTELAPNLRLIKTRGSIARDQFDSIFRRNLIEKTGFGKKKRSKSKLPKVKFHSTERGKKDDDDDDKVEIHK